MENIVPLVSVIMGVYNVTNKKMMKLALDSIIEQSYSELEIIICDDGSSQECRDILKKMCQKDSRIILIRNNKNKGLAYSLNKCLKVAKGKYIARMDIDDYSYPNRIEKQVLFMENHLEYAFVGCWAGLFEENKDLLIGERRTLQKPAKKDFLFTNAVIHATMLMRRDVLIKENGYKVSWETRRAEDYELFMRLYSKGYFAYNIPEILYLIREDRNTFARRTYRHRVEEMYVRLVGFYKLGLYPAAILFVIKPMIVGLIPQAILRIMRKERIDHKTKVSLSFDDGRKDNITRALKILHKYDIPATFNITTGYVDGTSEIEGEPCLNESMSINDIKGLFNEGFEVANHGDCHKNTLNDIRCGANKINSWLGRFECTPMGFASPHSKLKERTVLKKIKLFRKNKVLYVRIGIRGSKNLIRRIIIKLAHLTGSTVLYCLGMGHSLVTTNSYIIHSIPIINKTTTKQVETIIKKAVIKRKNCVLMFHSILKESEPFYDDPCSWDYEKFEKLCKFLNELRKENEISICKTEDLLER